MLSDLSVGIPGFDTDKHSPLALPFFRSERQDIEEMASKFIDDARKWSRPRTASAAANDVSFNNMSFNPAHQISGATITNAAYKWTVSTTGTDAYAAPNGLNQYTSMTPAGQSAPPANGQDCTGHAEAISYDCNGNLTGDGTLTLAYDPENRLMSASKTGMSASYLYDPLGRRTTKTVSGTVTNFLHDGDTEIGEYNASGAIIRRFVPGPAIDRPIAMVSCTVPGNSCAGTNATKTMFHVDKMGSVVAMSNASNGQLATNGGPYIYDAYGNCMSGGSPCSTLGTPYLYTGQRFDPETGLYFYRARCYSPNLGRFCQTDPVGYKDDLNWYTYVQDDPSDKTDPTGREVFGANLSFTWALGVDSSRYDVHGTTSEVGIVWSQPNVHLGDTSEWDIGVYVTGGKAQGIGIVGGPGLTLQSGTVRGMETNGQYGTQFVLSVGEVSISVSKDPASVGIDPKAIKAMKPSALIKLLKLKGLSPKVLPKEGLFVGSTFSKTSSFSVRDFLNMLFGKKE